MDKYDVLNMAERNGCKTCSEQGYLTAKDVQELIDDLGVDWAADFIMNQMGLKQSEPTSVPYDDAAVIRWRSSGQFHVSAFGKVTVVDEQPVTQRRPWTLWETMEGAAALTAGFLGARAVMRR